MTAEKIFIDFLKQIEDYVKSFQSEPLLAFYRGSNKSSYELIPSLFRNKEKLRFVWDTDDLENNLFYDITSYGEHMLKNENDWHILYQMQHHGFPTRLLDWTESLGTALYFAVEFSKETDRPSIWVLDPFVMNQKSETNNIAKMDYLTLYNPVRDFKYSYYETFVNIENAGKTFNYPKAIYPIKANERIRAQKGVFTIHGTEEQCLTRLMSRASLKKFIIPQKAINAAKDFLKNAGINHFSMFPDLEGLSRQIREEYYKY